MISNTERQLVWVMRAIWGVLLCELLVMAVFFFVAVPAEDKLARDEAMGMRLFLISAVVLLLVTPAVYFCRNQMYKRFWQEDRVTVGAYFFSNIVIIIVFYVIALVTLIFSVFIGATLANLLVFIVAAGLHAINFPTGKPLVSMEPRIGLRDES